MRKRNAKKQSKEEKRARRLACIFEFLVEGFFAILDAIF